MAELTSAQRAIVAERQKHRLALRQEYLKQSSNPYRFGDGGHLVRDSFRTVSLIRCYVIASSDCFLVHCSSMRRWCGSRR